MMDVTFLGAPRVGCRATRVLCTLGSPSGLHLSLPYIHVTDRWDASGLALPVTLDTIRQIWHHFHDAHDGVRSSSPN